MKNLRFDYTSASKFVKQHEIENMIPTAKLSQELLVTKSGAGKEFTGWLNLPSDYDKDEFERILKASKKIQQDSDYLIVIDIIYICSVYD